MPAFYRAYNDEDLVILMSQGDEAAFTEIYDRYWKRIFVLAAAKLDDLGLAEDLVQDLLGDLWRRRSEIRLTGKLESYLTVALKYKVINVLVVRKRERAFKTTDGVSLADHSTENWLDFEELKEQLAQLVGKLPERCRITYRLGREQGLSQKDIARHMNISEKAVEQNITRALHSLRLGLKYLFLIFF
jgi:RNA polymerase sigma-70 factor (ECF subfamily)